MRRFDPGPRLQIPQQLTSTHQQARSCHCGDCRKTRRAVFAVRDLEPSPAQIHVLRLQEPGYQFCRFLKEFKTAGLQNHPKENLSIACATFMPGVWRRFRTRWLRRRCSLGWLMNVPNLPMPKRDAPFAMRSWQWRNCASANLTGFAFIYGIVIVKSLNS
jgi:hypothetical protein